MEGVYPLVVIAMVRNRVKRKEINWFLLEHNGIATGGHGVIGDPWPVEKGKRALLAGSKLSGKVSKKGGALHFVQGKQGPTEGRRGQGGHA